MTGRTGLRTTQRIAIGDLVQQLVRQVEERDRRLPELLG
jgi:hypothetical protein